MKGIRVDGHQFIDKAIGRGASVIVCETLPDSLLSSFFYILVKDSRAALAQMAANYYGNPTDSLKVIGITGTNGKTSTATLLHRLFSDLGETVGLISTIVYKVGSMSYPSAYTTPDILQLQQLFADMVQEGCEYCFMEVSSHALEQGRVDGVPFSLAIYSNISHDHIDYHGSFQAYINAKKRLFDGLSKDAIALINTDDRHANIMVQNTRGTVKRYAVKRMADYRARVLDNTIEGLLLDIDGWEVWFRLVGRFNAYNLLAVYATALELGFDKEEVLRVLSRMDGVPGRFQLVQAPSGNKRAIVDYAHTPDALKNVLETIREVNSTRGHVITVVGCGGDRDKGKRPKMAKIALDYSHQVILTSDNPRTEKPEDILLDMCKGVPRSAQNKVFVIENRKEAIKMACRLAGTHDVILIAGKGHEDYQEINGVKYPFDDREVVLECFELFS